MAKGSEAKVAVGATSVNNLSKRERQAFAMFTAVAIAKLGWLQQKTCFIFGGKKTCYNCFIITVISEKNMLY